MRTSGRGRSDVVLFLAPALIFLGVWIYIEGGLPAAIQMVDRLVLKGASALMTAIATAFS
jgi:hypothetical protein